MGDMGRGYEISVARARIWGCEAIVLGIADWLRFEDDIRQVFQIKPIQDAGDTLKYEQITN